MRIVLAYNEPLPSRYQQLGEQVAVASVLASVSAIAAALEAQGHQVARCGLEPPLNDALAELARQDADLIFNLFEGFEGRPETEADFALGLARLGVPFTGAAAATLKLCLDKGRTKRLLTAQGIPTPAYQLLEAATLERFSLPYPVIVKPAAEDASHGLSAASVVSDAAGLARQLLQVEQNYGKPALVERFLSGREFNIAVLGGPQPRTLPPSEIVYSHEWQGPQILTYAAKWQPEDPAYKGAAPLCPAPVSEAMLEQIRRLALVAWEAVGSPAYARMDLRADSEGNLYVLEVNPNPDLDPEAGLALQARAAGLSYNDLVAAIVDLARAQNPRDAWLLRPLEAREVDALVDLTAATGFFRPEEVAVAREVLTECAEKGWASGYQAYVADDGRCPLGYVCFGDTPLTRGTWDVFWIAVAREQQGRGIGKRLLRLAEAEIIRQGGRLVLVETSGLPLYEPTRRFYLAMGYEEVSRIADFYDVGDARVTYGKRLT